MQVIRDDWTPLFDSLKSKLSPLSRKQLLFEMIGDLQNIAMLNMGDSGIARPMPWQILTEKYSQEYKQGNRTPNLILTGRLRDSFVHSVDESKATLTNTAEYADQHQFGAKYKNLPARPYYPVSPGGDALTPLAEARLKDIVEQHFSGA